MKLHTPKIRIGLRTVKTVLAVLLSMIIVDHLGATTSKLIFAMLGAMAAVQPTFKESLDSCIAQIVGVILGALIGVLLLSFIDSPLLSISIGMVVIITMYNLCKVSFSPSLPCFILVLLCTTADIAPFDYAVGRIWDTTVGLLIGFGINILIFPYDTSKGIRVTVCQLTETISTYLENLFDGDDEYPNTLQAREDISRLTNQINQFSKQKLVLHLRRQKKELEFFRLCEERSKQLLAHIEVLQDLGSPGVLSDENRQNLEDAGLKILDTRKSDHADHRDIVTNYHVCRILEIKKQLQDAITNT